MIPRYAPASPGNGRPRISTAGRSRSARRCWSAGLRPVRTWSARVRRRTAACAPPATTGPILQVSSSSSPRSNQRRAASNADRFAVLLARLVSLLFDHWSTASRVLEGTYFGVLLIQLVNSSSIDVGEARLHRAHHESLFLARAWDHTRPPASCRTTVARIDTQTEQIFGPVIPCDGFSPLAPRRRVRAWSYSFERQPVAENGCDGERGWRGQASGFGGGGIVVGGSDADRRR